jgi:hypothetical protein
MAIRHLPVVGRPTSTPTLLGKIAIDKIAVEEYFVGLAQVDATALVRPPHVNQ